MMQPPDKDNEFDQLIKEAVDKYHPTGSKPDWEQMRPLLDKHMPVRNGLGRKAFFIFILIFLLLGGTYLYFNQINGESSIPVKEQQASGNPASQVPSSTVNHSIENITGNIGQKKQNKLLQNRDSRQKQNAILSGNSVKPTNKLAGNFRTKRDMGELAENDIPAKTGDVAPSANNNESVNITNDTKAENKLQNEITGLNNKLAEGTVSSQVTIAKNKIPAGTSNTSGKKDKSNENRKHPLEFSLVYAPELTTIRFSNVDKPGSNYGLLVGYRVSKNLTIQTGIIKSRKNYIANGNDFLTEYPVLNNYKLLKVDGYCMMFEIPLNIKSQISKWKKLNLFYTAGISSYFMKSEFYTYHYSTNYGDYSRSAKYSSQKNYWLSLATVGLGLEKSITNTLNIAATPFIKIPFKGMGEGNLKLLGTGINFSISYIPSFTKN